MKATCVPKQWVLVAVQAQQSWGKGGSPSGAELVLLGQPSPCCCSPAPLQCCTTAVTSILAQGSPDFSMPLSLHAVTHPAAVQCLVPFQSLPHPPCALLGTVEDTGTFQALEPLFPPSQLWGALFVGWHQQSQPRDLCSPKAASSQIQHPTFQQSTTKCSCMWTAAQSSLILIAIVNLTHTLTFKQSTWRGGSRYFPAHRSALRGRFWAQCRSIATPAWQLCSQGWACQGSPGLCPLSGNWVCAANENKEPKPRGFGYMQCFFWINIRILTEINIVFGFISCTWDSERNLLSFSYLAIKQMSLWFLRELWAAEPIR